MGSREFLPSFINIRAPNPEYIEHEMFELCNITVEIFNPKKGVKMTNVIEYDVIFEGTGPVQRVGILHKNNNPYLISVYVTEDDINYFVNSDGNWKGITSDEYEDYFIDLFISANSHINDLFDSDKPKSSDVFNCVMR